MTDLENRKAASQGRNVLEVFVPAVSPTSVELWQSNRYYPTQEEYLFAIAGAYSFEGANPRHEHEWQIWETTRLPDGAILIPGVITQSSVLVEHPELVAQRLVRYADCVGKENLIAGADCGFGTFAGLEESQERVAWAKLEALVQGARLASQSARVTWSAFAARGGYAHDHDGSG